MNKIIKFGKLSSGEEIYAAVIQKGSYKVNVMSLGATLTEFSVPDKHGNPVDIVLGFDNPQSYIDTPTFFGMTVGPFANRIANGRFSIDGKNYQVEQNENGNILHSGKASICWNIWDMELINDNGVRFTTKYKEGPETFPGNMIFECTYVLESDGKLIINHRAKTDKPTFVNMTNHSYFNLHGNSTKDILDCRLSIPDAGYIEIDSKLIPTGKIIDSKNTPFDFSYLHEIGDKIKEAGGYDHCYTFNNWNKKLEQKAILDCPENGISLRVFTTLPGMQVYTSNFLSDKIIDKKGLNCCKTGAVCLETQYYPDSPNHTNFPSCRLNPKEEYNHTTIYKADLI